MLHQRAPGNTSLPSPVAPADFLDFQTRATSYENLTAFQEVDFNVSQNGDPETVYSAVVTPNFFDTLGAKPILGRTFAPGEDSPGNNQVAVLSFGLWQRLFARDPNIVGRQIKLNGSVFSVIGVMGKSVRFPVGGELWAPLTFSAYDRQDRENHTLHVLARLKSGVSESQARAELQTIAASLARNYPKTNQGWGILVQPLNRFIVGDFNREYTLLLLGAVFFVLLIVCANVMSLHFARISGRQKEFGVRAALGASRWAIAREIVAESLLLSLAGGLASLLFSSWSLSLIVSSMPADVAKYISAWDQIQLDGRTLAFTLGVAVFAGIFAGLLPALRIRPDVNDALKEGARGSSAGRSRLRSRSVLVIAQISAAMVLLAGAGLMLKGSRSLITVNHGLHPESILTMQMVLSDRHYGEATQRVAFWDRTLERISALPGVQAASLVSNPPYGTNERLLPYTVEGQPAENASDRKSAQVLSVSPNYLETFGIPLVAGRQFRDSDGPKSEAVVIVSENFARRNWARADAIGRHVRLGAHGDWLTVIGVVKDVRYDPWVKEIAPAIYQPYSQSAPYYTYVAIRAKGDPLALAAPARRAVLALDIDRPMWEIKTLDRVIAEDLIGLNYVAVMLAVLGGIAILLSAAGIYGLMAYMVVERTREIGIRLALGAERQDVLRMLARRGLLLTLAGLVIGLAISIPLARVLSSLIFGVGATDATAFGATAFLLAAVALLACYIPARRAMSVDPVIALRQE
jgi:putative ABC transport system permease protein